MRKVRLNRGTCTKPKLFTRSVRGIAEKALKELLKKQRAKVEEIKKKTNYNHTRDLIQKYDEASPSATPLRPRFGPVPPGGLQQTPVQRRPVPVNGAPIMQTPGPGAPSAALQNHLTCM